MLCVLSFIEGWGGGGIIYVKLLTFSIAIDFVLHPADTCLHCTDYTHTVGGSIVVCVPDWSVCAYAMCVLAQSSVLVAVPIQMACVNWEL